MVLIRKHASLWALLSVLAGLIAAPFLIPENPDSMIFRNGLFGTLLLFACYVPLKDALLRADKRTLLCSAGFGLLLGFALSIGAELRFYSGLLPGFGSIIRRFAVPILAMPLLGGLSARFMLFVPANRRTLNGPFWVYWGILMLCWLPLLLAFYPGMLNYDLNTEYRQFYYGEWDDRHPLLYIAINYGIFHLGRLFGHPTAAVCATTLLRMSTFAAALAYGCVFVQRRRVPAWVIALMTALFAFLPVFSVMSVSSAKDTPFAAALLTLSLLTWEALEDPKAFFGQKKKVLLYVLSAVFVYHMRKNGVTALILLPALIVGVRGFRKQAAALCAVSLALTLLINTAIYAAFKPFDQPSFQFYSLPAQQLVRAYNLGSMTEEEKTELRSWYLEDMGLELLPQLADKAKGYLKQDRLKEERGQFLGLWARVGQKNLRTYAEAFLMLNMGSWYPDDLTHTDIYGRKGYLQTDEYDFSEYGVARRYMIPKLSAFIHKICRYNEYTKYPIVSLLFCTATPLWVLLLACAKLTAQRRTRFLSVTSGTLLLWLSYLFGPCTLPRYILPLFCLAPILLAVTFSSKE